MFKLLRRLLTVNSTVVTQDASGSLKRHLFQNFVKVLKQISIALLFTRSRRYLLTQSGDFARGVLQSSHPITRSALHLWYPRRRMRGAQAHWLAFETSVSFPLSKGMWTTAIFVLIQSEGFCRCCITLIINLLPLPFVL
jgi:hypothetical protein